MKLSGKQQEAVTTTEGPVCIVAGPGSGKTATIIERIYHLIHNKHIDPEHILAITFTNKATGEMGERITRRCGMGGGARCPTVCTFHALALDILKQHGERIGLPSPITVASEKEQKHILKKILKDVSGWTVKDALSAVSRYKLQPSVSTDERIQNIAHTYHEELTKKGMLDFDDLLLQTVKLFKDHTDVLKTYQERFQFILVDEYQDTNPIQAELLSLLVPPQHNICIIGDPNQAIYGFRGATRDNFFSFTRTYPQTKTITLSHNYRSTKAIVEVASALFQEQTPTQTALQDEGVPVQRIALSSAEAEGRHIVASIRQLIGGIDMVETDSQTMDESVYDAGEIAVLFRLHAVGTFLEQFFREAGVPYTRVGGMTFFEQPDVRQIIEEIAHITPEQSISEHVQVLIDGRSIPDTTAKDRRRENRLEELITRARIYDYLSPEEGKRSLLAEATLERPEEARTPEDKVALMSVHAAKGLEFPVVFVAGVEEGLFPYHRVSNSEDEIEEERRLLYVAMTRAKERLYLSYSTSRRLYGETITPRPSRFLDDLPPDLIEHTTITPPKKKEKPPQQALF